MAGGNKIRAQLVGPVNEPAKLQVLIAHHTGIGRASGLVFIGASDDDRFRAFDAKTGKELWTIKLGASAESVPITYMGKDGRQYVAVVGTGGGSESDPPKRWSSSARRPLAIS